MTTIRSKIWLFFLCLVCLTGSCSYIPSLEEDISALTHKKKDVAPIEEEPAVAMETPVAEPAPPEEPKGLGIKSKLTATWYGGRFHGRCTANGEVFNKKEMTAAHATLPFGSRVKVRNLSNERELVVRITDRCCSKEVIDVSEAAAVELGFKRQGRAKVELEIMELPKDADASIVGALLADAEEKKADTSAASVNTDEESDANTNIARKTATTGLKTRLDSAVRARIKTRKR